MIAYESALKKILSKAKPLPAESVPLTKSLGRILAEDLKAKEPIPPFQKATMDGYAVRSQDLVFPVGADAVELLVIEDLPAGKISKTELKPGKAIRIMTGAVLPKGADAVVMVEDTEKHGKKVLIRRRVRPGENIGQAGEDVKKGELILEKGQRIGPAEMGMLASLGSSRIKAISRPKVAIVSTGDEIVEPGARIRPGQIRNSNGYSLFALALVSGAEAIYLGIAPDQKSALRAKIREAKKMNILVLTGGVSVGDYDLVKDQLQGFGVRPIFWKARIKPGKPIFFGTRRKQLVFGLPGNPASALVTFHLFVRPAIDKMLGKKELGPRKGKAILLEDLSLKTGRKHFLRGILDQNGVVLQVHPFPNQKSGVLKSMVKSKVLIVIPPEIGAVEKGEEVEIIYLD